MVVSDLITVGFLRPIKTLLDYLFCDGFMSVLHVDQCFTCIEHFTFYGIQPALLKCNP
jgi:hypothetical protein